MVGFAVVMISIRMEVHLCTHLLIFVEHNELN